MVGRSVVPGGRAPVGEREVSRADAVMVPAAEKEVIMNARISAAEKNLLFHFVIVIRSLLDASKIPESEQFPLV